MELIYTKYYFLNKKIQHIFLYKEIHNAISKKINILSCYNEHGIMILYDETICLSDTTSITNIGA